MYHVRQRIRCYFFVLYSRPYPPLHWLGLRAGASSRKRPRQGHNMSCPRNPHISCDNGNATISTWEDRLPPPMPGVRRHPLPLPEHNKKKMETESSMKGEESLCLDKTAHRQQETDSAPKRTIHRDVAAQAGSADRPQVDATGTEGETHGVRRMQPGLAFSPVTARTGETTNGHECPHGRDIAPSSVDGRVAVAARASVCAKGKQQIRKAAASIPVRPLPAPAARNSAVAVAVETQDANSAQARGHVAAIARVIPASSTVAATVFLGECVIPDTVGAQTASELSVLTPTGGAHAPSAAPATRPTVSTTGHSAAAPMNTSLPLSGGDGSPEDSGQTPPEKKFALAHQQVFQSANGTGRGREVRRRGKARRGSFATGRGRKLRPKAPLPARNALVGIWRTQHGKGDGAKW